MALNQRMISRAFPGFLLGLTFSIEALGQVAAPDPLVVLNDASRAAYRGAKESALGRNGPVILVEGDSLVLIREKERTEVRYVPDRYHALKAVSHIPLALDVMLASAGEGDRLEEGLLEELRRYRGLIVAARQRVAALGLEPGPAERQAAIVAESLGFIDARLEARACRSEDRVAYTRRMAPLVLANADDAARAQLDALHRQVLTWKGKLAAAQWDRLTVVVMGRQLPRKGNVAVQYFARLLGQPGESQRIVYAESLFDESKALDLLATRAIDTRVGRDFFDDPFAMHKDLLGEAAREYLPRLFGKAERPDRDRTR
jgi:hypothetical protein